MSTRVAAVDDFVSAVVPAYNAAATIDETLRSIRSQTHRDLEILVVDDGSTDGTRDIVLRHAAVDDRIRLLVQPNSGVAAARNRGIAEARGAFVAPIDADDLWAPEKITEQLRVMREGGPKMGLVYTWSALIDAESYEVNDTQEGRESGDVLRQLCRSNLIGNGSAVLVRREAAVEAEGFDPRLRALGAEGCEDISFYLRIAQSWHFGYVPKPLTGYRQSPVSMSTDGYRMYRSWAIVAREARLRLPHCRPDIEMGLAKMARWSFVRDLRHKHYRSVAILLVLHPRTLIGQILKYLWQKALHAGASKLGDRPARVAPDVRKRFPVGAVVESH